MGRRKPDHPLFPVLVELFTKMRDKKGDVRAAAKDFRASDLPLDLIDELKRKESRRLITKALRVVFPDSTATSRSHRANRFQLSLEVVRPLARNERPAELKARLDAIQSRLLDRVRRAKVAIQTLQRERDRFQRLHKIESYRATLLNPTEELLWVLWHKAWALQEKEMFRSFGEKRRREMKLPPSRLDEVLEILYLEDDRFSDDPEWPLTGDLRTATYEAELESLKKEMRDNGVPFLDLIDRENPPNEKAGTATNWCKAWGRAGRNGRRPLLGLLGDRNFPLDSGRLTTDGGTTWEKTGSKDPKPD